MPAPDVRVTRTTAELGQLTSEAHAAPDMLPDLERALGDVLASRPPREVREPMIAWMDSTLTAIARERFADDDPVHRVLYSAFGKLRQQRLRVKDRRRWILGRLCQIIDNLDSWVSEVNGDGLLPGGLDPWMVLVFGSVARGDSAPNDLDLMLLYEDNPAWSLHALVKMADYDTSPFTEPLKALTYVRGDYVDIMPVEKDCLWDHVLKLERRPPRPMVVWACGERVGPVWEEAVERGVVGGDASFDPEEDARTVARSLSIRRIRRALGEVGCKALYRANWAGHIVDEWFEFRQRLYDAERGGHWKECSDVLHDAAEWAAGDREGRALPEDAQVEFLQGLLEAERLEHARLNAEEALLRPALGAAPREGG